MFPSCYNSFMAHIKQEVDHLYFHLNLTCLFLPSRWQTSLVSVEGLTKLVDPSQLTDDFEGSLEYNHEEWIELRVALEEFLASAVHLLSRLEDLQEMLAKKEFPVDVEGSRRLIDEHTQLKKKVMKAPVEELDHEGQRLLQCIRSSDGFSGRNCISGSADFQSVVPKIASLLDKLHSTRQHLHQMWHLRKLKLDQCFQLRLFEQDAEKVSEHGFNLVWTDKIMAVYGVRAKVSWTIFEGMLLRQECSQNFEELVYHDLKALYLLKSINYESDDRRLV